MQKYVKICENMQKYVRACILNGYLGSLPYVFVTIGFLIVVIYYYYFLCTITLEKHYHKQSIDGCA